MDEGLKSKSVSEKELTRKIVSFDDVCIFPKKSPPCFDKAKCPEWPILAHLSKAWVKEIQVWFTYLFAGGVPVIGFLLEKRWTEIKGEKTEAENGWSWQKQKGCHDDRGKQIVRI